MFADTDRFWTWSPFGRFLAVSLVLHIACLGLVFSLDLKKKTELPSAYIVRIVEAPPVFTPLPPAAIKEIPSFPQVPPAKAERKTAGPAVMPEPEQPSAPELPQAAESPRAAELPKTGELPRTGDLAKVGELPKAAPGLPGERLFDRDVIKEFARDEELSIKRKDSITFDTSEYKYKNYMKLLKDTIEGIWIYPREAAEKGIYGDLIIRFVIRKDGTLGSIKVIRTSGHQELDRAALKALKDAEPFWPLPDSWGVDALEVTGHFIYSIYGRYVK